MRFFCLLILVFLTFPVLAQDQVPLDKTGRYRTSGKLKGGELHSSVISKMKWGRHKDFERLVIQVADSESRQAGPPSKRACLFRVEAMPGNRLRFYFHDTFNFLATYPESISERSKVFRTFLRFPTYDHTSLGMEIELSPNTEWEVFELKNPGRIVVDVRRR